MSSEWVWWLPDNDDSRAFIDAVMCETLLIQQGLLDPDERMFSATPVILPNAVHAPYSGQEKTK